MKLCLSKGDEDFGLGIKQGMDLIKNLSLAFLIVGMGASSAFAQGDTSSAIAGVIERTATPKDTSLPADRLPQIESQIPETPDDNTTRVIIRDFVFDGNTSVATEDLETVAQSFRNREVTFADLKKLCRQIQQFYQIKGYFLVRAVLPPQDISQGMLRVQIIEGAIGAIEIRGNKRIPTEFINSRLKVDPTKPCLRYNHLLRSLILLNEYPSIDVKTTLVKGRAPGTTDMIVDVIERPGAKVRAWFNNGGARYVSEINWGQQLEFYDIARTGDVLRAHVALGSPARNLRVGGVSYTAPVNTRDTKVTVGYDYSDFHARRQISDLGIRGATQTVSLGVLQPIVRNMTSSMDARAGFAMKDIKNFTLNTLNARDRLRVVTLGLDYNRRDRFYGRTFWGNTLSFGIPHFLGSNDANAPDMSRAGSGGRFAKWEGEITRVQGLPEAAFLLLRGDYQLASETLPASEEFYIGGLGSVRGYPQAEFLGDSGYFVNVELRLPPYGLRELNVPYLNRPLKDIVQFALFFDHGEAYRKSVLPGEFKDRSLTSMGYGLRFFVNDIASLDMDWAYPVSGNDTSDGSDSSFYVKLNVDL